MSHPPGQSHSTHLWNSRHSDLACGGWPSDGVSRIVHEHLVKNVVELHTLNYQHNGLLFPNCLSTHNSYIHQELSAFNNRETDIQVCTLEGFIFLFRHPNHHMLWNYGQALSFSSQAIACKCIVPFIGGYTIGTRGIFIYNRTTPAPRRTQRALGMILTGAGLAIGVAALGRIYLW